MEEFAAGTSAKLTFDHSYNDTPLTLTDFEYQVLNAQGEILEDYTTPNGFDPAAASTVVTVEQALNQSSDKVDIRQVNVRLITSDGTYNQTVYYKLLGDQTKLTVMVDSFMTFPESVVVRAKMSDRLEYYDELTDALKANALENTFRTFHKVAFKPMGYAPQNQPMYIDGLSESQFRALPTDFQLALKRAQLFQADALVESSPILDKIRHGIVSETIGESSMFFKQSGVTGSSTKYPGIADEAYSELSKYMYTSATSSQIWHVRRA